jgi:alpha-1,6-mannosyltransferase
LIDEVAVSTPPVVRPGRGFASVRCVRAGAGAGGLALLAAAGVWLALAAAGNDWLFDGAWAQEPRWARGPLAGILPGLRDSSFSIAFVLMLLGYLVAVARADAVPERWALGIAFGLILLFGLAPPILSSDVFGYVDYARLEVVHGLNPYLHAPSAAPHDPAFGLVFWQHATSPYGPLFTLGSSAVGGASVPVGVWTLKAAAATGGLAAVALIARAARRYGRSAARAVLFLGCNPVLLVYGIGGGHNDLIVLALVAAGILLLASERSPRAAGAALVLAAGVKLTAGLLLPFAYLAARPRRRFFAGAAAAVAVTAAVSVIAFGAHFGGTLLKIATSADFAVDYSGPDLIGRLLGTGLTAGVRAACAVAALAVVATCLWRVVRGADWLVAGTWAMLAVLMAIPSLVPWYIAWVLPTAALAPGRSARLGAALLTAGLVLTRLPVLGFQAT